VREPVGGADDERLERVPRVESVAAFADRRPGAILAVAGLSCRAPWGRERAAAAAYSADLLRHLGQYADAGQRALTALDLARDDDQLTPSVVLAGAALGFCQAYINDPIAGRTAVRYAVDAPERSGSPTDIAPRTCTYLGSSRSRRGRKEGTKSYALYASF